MLMNVPIGNEMIVINHGSAVSRSAGERSQGDCNRILCPSSGLVASYIIRIKYLHQHSNRE